MGAYDTMRKLESLRKKMLVFQYFPVMLVAAGFLLHMAGNRNGLIAIGIGVAAALIFQYRMPFLKKEYKTLYKNTFVKSLLGSVLEDVDYNWNMGFSETEVMGFGIIKMGNRFFSEDYIRASYKGVKFRQADVVIKNVTGSGRHRSVQLYFSGRMFEFDFTSKAVANVKVFSKNYMSRLNLSADKLETEDVNFNSQFNVFSANAHDAFYILTPHMMEKIAAINRRYPNMAFRFAPGKLYVGIVTDDSFDAKIDKKLSYPKEQARMQKDVQVITDIIEMIDLVRDSE